MKTIRLLFLALVLFGAGAVSAQSSMWMAKEYIKEGNYQAAARKLQPLADGGDAEAQYLAAKLFLEGKFNTAKAEEQGVKYARMAANQGYEDAITLLADHYEGTKPEMEFQILKQYVEPNADLRQGTLGERLAHCYLFGTGTDKDEARGWQILEQNVLFESMLDRKEYARLYWRFKQEQAGKASLEDYADYLFAKYERDKFQKLLKFIESKHSGYVDRHYSGMAVDGNAFACAMYADILYERGDVARARTYIQKSIQGGSAYGRSIQDKINYTPVSFVINSKYDSRTRFVKIEHRYDKTILYGMFKGQHSDSWTQFYQDDYLLCNGRKYYMTSTSKKIYGLQSGAERSFTLEFKPVPQDWSMIQLCYNGRVYWEVTAQDVIDKKSVIDKERDFWSR